MIEFIKVVKILKAEKIYQTCENSQKRFFVNVFENEFQSH